MKTALYTSEIAANMVATSIAAQARLLHIASLNGFVDTDDLQAVLMNIAEQADMLTKLLDAETDCGRLEVYENARQWAVK